jgi:lipoic acid synthetase
MIEMRSRPYPKWIKGILPFGKAGSEVSDVLSDLNVKCVCREAACPNKGECWSAKHVTFMILGDACTRNCKFCNVKKAAPAPPDEKEPGNIAASVKKLGIKYAVITSVTRDDLSDKGALQFASTVGAVKRTSPGTMVEVLIPDMGADEELIKKIAVSGADVLSHNIEIPEKFYPHVRSKASYRVSLRTLETLKGHSSGRAVKSSMIIGLGEVFGDICHTMKDARDAGVDIFYIGQYLRPSKKHWPVSKYYSPEEFDTIREEAARVGFKVVYSGPLVRSSYKAHDAYRIYAMSGAAKNGADMK